MANFSPHCNLELPISPEHYNIGVFNKNNLVIDSELYKLYLKNKRQDEIFATIELLNQEVTRAITKENEIIENINAVIGKLKESDKIMQEDYSQKIDELLFLFLQNNEYETENIIFPEIFPET